MVTSHSNRHGLLPIDYCPDFTKLHAAEFLSDIDIVIREEARDHEAEPRSKHPNCSTSKTVAAHKILLWSLSTFFQAKVHARTYV